MVSAYTAVGALYPIQESKIKDIAAKRAVKRPGVPDGRSSRWPRIQIIKRTNKDVGKDG